MPLFHREKRKIFLTTAGEKYLVAIEHALDEIDIATRRLRSSPNISSVNISVVPAFLTRWLVPRIRDFQEQYPDIELRLSASTRTVDFLRSDVDMAIFFGRGDWPNSEAHFLHSVTLVPVCSPKLLQGEKPLTTLDALRHHTILRVSSRQDEWKQFLEESGLTHSYMAHSMSFSSSSLALGAAIEGAGVALTDISLAEREIGYGQLVVPFDLKLETKNGFYLAHQQGRPQTYGMKAFHDWIMHRIEKDWK